MKKFFGFLMLLSLLWSYGYSLDSNNFIRAKDVPYDEGGELFVEWQYHGDDAKTVNIYRSEGEDWGLIKKEADLQGKFTDKSLDYKKGYKYKMEILNEDGEVIDTLHSNSVVPKPALFDMKKLSILIALLLISFFIVYYILAVKRGVEFKIRKIPALESVDEAIGRATEMGKPILFIPGIMDIDDVQTVAGIIILGEVATKTAIYDAARNVPISRSMVMSTGRETVKEAYLKAGRPDAFNDNMVHYLTDDQFGYVSGVDGIMVREKPAAIFMLGTFYAESLILAETGNSIGAIQIAGTAMPSQLPFFVAACDYTLIGEELFAASAYMSKQPHMLGALKGQDMAKLLIMIILILGAILELIAPQLHVVDWFTNIG